MQPPIIGPWNGPDLAYLPDNPAILSIEAMLSRPDNRQSETSEYDDAALQETIAPTPRRIQQEDDELLTTPSGAQDRQPGWNDPGESAQPPRFPPTSPVPPEPGEWNAPRGRRRPDIVFIVLAVLWILAGSGGYIVFSNHLSGTTSINSAIDVQSTATAKAAN